MNPKKLTLAIMMGALGNVLFLLSYVVGQIAPGVSFDFSLIAVLIAGLYGGPVVGITAGAIAGLLPGLMYGPLGTGGVLGLIGLPVGNPYRTDHSSSMPASQHTSEKSRFNHNSSNNNGFLHPRRCVHVHLFFISITAFHRTTNRVSNNCNHNDKSNNRSCNNELHNGCSHRQQRLQRLHKSPFCKNKHEPEKLRSAGCSSAFCLFDK
jgi:hypothetical protein